MQRDKRYGIFCVRDDRSKKIEGLTIKKVQSVGKTVASINLTGRKVSVLNQDTINQVLPKLKYRYPKLGKKAKFIVVRLSRLNLPIPIKIVDREMLNTTQCEFKILEGVDLRKYKLKNIR